MQDVKRIESYGLGDFCKDVESALKEGYSFDFESNENFPTAFGTMLTCGLVKTSTAQVDEPANLPSEVNAAPDQASEVAPEGSTEEPQAAGVEPTAKRGPKAKNK